MDAVETGTIIIITLVIAGMIFGVISEWKYQKTLQDTKEMFDLLPYENNLESVKFEDLIDKVGEFKEFAVRGNENANKTFYIKESVNVSKEDFFETVLNLHYCKTLSSKELGCGDDEAFTYFSRIEGPAIISVEYIDGRMRLFDIKYPPPVCGNLIPEYYGGEECDDGNSVAGDGCSSACMLEFCGDAIVTSTNPNNYYVINPGPGFVPEACDDANLDNMDNCSTACQLAVCGDGFIWIGEEGCDDRNFLNGDGCNANCEVESDYQCFGMPSVCGMIHMPGLLSKYYSYSSTFNVYTDMANVQYLVPVVERVDYYINRSYSNNWPDGAITSSLLLISEGLFRAPVNGTYTFYVKSNSASAMFLDEDILIENNYYSHNERESNKTIALVEGYVPIKIVMFRSGSWGSVYFSFSGPGYSKRIVPEALLSHMELPS